MAKLPHFSLLVVQPDAECPVERFGPWLEEGGAKLHVVRPHAGDTVPDTVETDGLVVLGGDMGVHDQSAHPWLADVASLTRSAVTLDVPTLGICLGGQILAAATGGEVGLGAAGMESGVIEITARPEVVTDELMGALPWPLLQGSMHRDAITALPPGAAWLAESPAYPHQAFRVGSSAWGVQFHPELSPELYQRWAAYVREDQQTTERIHAGIAQFDRLDEQVRTGARALATAFAGVVAARTAVRPSKPSAPRGAAG